MELHCSIGKLYTKNMIENEKVVGDLKTIKKQDLLNYAAFLNKKYKNLVNVYLLKNKTKQKIVDEINFKLDTKHIELKVYSTVKGTSNSDLVKVSVQKIVHKIE